MGADESKAEGWVRKKPKKIIQNQTLIVVILILGAMSPLICSGVVFWFVFSFYPSIMIPAIIILWFICSIAYIALRLVSRRLLAKEKSS
ncbi:MAG TPA: hypothetical protein VMS94_05830 [Acidobacteriota bacterium]|jgi:hypothetical protein|nr:hypothetical protein [Acidobacteriota bacterium]